MSELTLKAQGKWPHILTRLGIDAEFLKNKHGPCPVCGGKDRFRFDDKDGRGTFYCNQCGAGDGVVLLQALHGWDFKTTAKEVEAVLGDVPVASPIKSDKPERDPRPLLQSLAKGGVRITEGDEVSRYLRGRGLIVPPHGIKLNPSVGYFEGGRRVGRYPAMLSLVTSADGKAATYHLTYLQDGKKAPIDPAKKVMPSVEPIAGGAVRLFPPASHMGIAEGIETAIAAHMLFKIPVWAVLNTSGVKSFVPPRGVEALTIFADNDENFAGQAAAYTAANALNAKGYHCDVMVPNRLNADWNDWLLEHQMVADLCREFDASVQSVESADKAKAACEGEGK